MDEAHERPLLSVADKEILRYAALDIAQQEAGADDESNPDFVVWTQSDQLASDIRFYAVDTESGRRKRIGAHAVYTAVQRSLVRAIVSPDFDTESAAGEAALVQFAELESAQAKQQPAELRAVLAAIITPERQVAVGERRTAVLQKICLPAGKAALALAGVDRLEPIASVTTPVMPEAQSSIFDKPHVAAATAPRKTMRVQQQYLHPAPSAQAKLKGSADRSLTPVTATEAMSRVARMLVPEERPRRLSLKDRMKRIFTRSADKAARTPQRGDNSSDRSIDWLMKPAEPAIEGPIIAQLSWPEVYWHEGTDGLELHARRGDVVLPINDVPNFDIEVLRGAYKNAWELAAIKVNNFRKKEDHAAVEQAQRHLDAVLAWSDFMLALTPERLISERAAVAAAFRCFKPAQQLPLKTVFDGDVERQTFDVRGTAEQQASVNKARRRDTLMTAAAISVGAVLIGGIGAWKQDVFSRSAQSVETNADDELSANRYNTALPKLVAPKPKPAAKQTLQAIDHADQEHRAYWDAQYEQDRATWREINIEAQGISMLGGTIKRNDVYDYQFSNVQAGSGIGVWHMAEALIRARNFDVRMKPTASKLETALLVQHVVKQAESYGLVRDEAGQPVVFAGTQLLITSDVWHWLERSVADAKAQAVPDVSQATMA